MPRISSHCNFLLNREKKTDFVPATVYRAQRGSIWSPNTLLVDYELSNLKTLNTRNMECNEFAALASARSPFLFFVYQYDSLSQVNRDLQGAARLLDPSQELRVVIAPNSGANKITRAAEVLFQRVDHATRSGTQLLVCRGPQLLKELLEATHTLSYVDEVTERTLSFVARSGMFSCEHIDTGTRLLLSRMPPVITGPVLDVGCGYGILGLVAAARGGTVTMLDADARAINLAQLNSAANGLTSTCVLDDNIRQPDNHFSLVISNPPTHAGSEVLQRLFSDMVRVCRPGGSTLLVVKEQLNYEKWLVKMGELSVLDVGGGFKILQINKRS